ncbi:MAG: hypothetical protein ACREIT_07030 [Tepidisphaeraceae bacterium]
MSKQLSDEDRRAVDLLLNRTTSTATVDGGGQGHGNGDNGGNGGGNGQFASSTHTAFHDRLGAVERMLHLLDEMPAPGPSVDLVARTMRLIEEAGAARETGEPARSLDTGVSAGDRPVA